MYHTTIITYYYCMCITYRDRNRERKDSISDLDYLPILKVNSQFSCTVYAVGFVCSLTVLTSCEHATS